MQQASNAKDQHIARLTSNLQTVIHTTTSYAPSEFVSQLCGSASGRVGELLRGSALRQSSCLSSTLAVAVFRLPGSVMIDCNDAFVQCGGWSREQLLHSTIRKPKPEELSSDAALSELRVCPLVVSRRKRVAGGGAASAYEAQYASSGQAMGALFSGAKHKVECVWRTRAASGELYEVTAHARYDKGRGEEAGEDEAMMLR